MHISKKRMEVSASTKTIKEGRLTLGVVVLVALGDIGPPGLTDEPLLSALARGAQQAFNFTAAAVIAGLPVALTLPQSDDPCAALRAFLDVGDTDGISERVLLRRL